MKEGKSILIVEDDTGIARLVAVVLKDSEHVMLTAGSIREAEEALAGGGVDVIILDRMLPDGDGIELFKKLKAAPETRHIPVLVLSGKISPDDQVEGLESGADDYVTKPFSAPELQARVHALLRRARKFAD